MTTLVVSELSHSLWLTIFSPKGMSTPSASHADTICTQAPAVLSRSPQEVAMGASEETFPGIPLGAPVEGGGGSHRVAPDRQRTRNLGGRRSRRLGLGARGAGVGGSFRAIFGRAHPSPYAWNLDRAGARLQQVLVSAGWMSSGGSLGCPTSVRLGIRTSTESQYADWP